MEYKEPQTNLAKLANEVSFSFIVLCKPGTLDKPCNIWMQEWVIV